MLTDIHGPTSSSRYRLLSLIACFLCVIVIALAWDHIFRVVSYRPPAKMTFIVSYRIGLAWLHYRIVFYRIIYRLAELLMGFEIIRRIIEGIWGHAPNY